VKSPRPDSNWGLEAKTSHDGPLHYGAFVYDSFGVQNTCTASTGQTTSQARHSKQRLESVT